MRRDKAPLERKLRRVAIRMFRSQLSELQAALLPAVQPLFESWRLQEIVSANLSDVAESLLSSSLVSGAAAYEQVIQNFLLAALLKAVFRAERDLQSPFRISADREAAIVRELGATMISNVNETTKARVRQILAESLEQHRSYSEMARLLKKEFVGWGTPSPLGHIRDRAELIAVTEIGNAYVRGQLETAREMEAHGNAMEKAWLTVGDERVDADCAGNEQQGWIALEDVFSSGVDAPLDHPGCRCSLRLRTTN